MGKGYKTRREKGRSSGFTLAELLIVVAIIAILVAVSIPVFVGQLEKARKAVCDNERAVMKHSCAVLTMSEDVNWTGVSYEKIRARLKEEGILDKEEFQCPSGGELTAQVSGDGISVTILCSKHDGEGSGGETVKNDTQKAMDSLNQLLADSLKGNTSRNTQFLRQFFKDNPDVLQKASPGDILTDDMITKWINGIRAKKSNLSQKQIDSIRESIGSYGEKQQWVVPYVIGDKAVTYYAADNTNFAEDKQCHTQTSLIYYNGAWYGSTNLNGKSDTINPLYTPATFDACNGDYNAVAEKLETAGWVKLSD